MTLPSKQDDGNVKAPALSRAVCVVVQVVAVGGVRWWSFYHQSSVSARTPPCGGGVLTDFTRQLVCDTALLLLLLLLSKQDLLSVATRRVETVGSRNRTAVSPHSVDPKPLLAGVAMSAQGFGVVWTASVESPSFHAVSLVPVRPVKYDVSSLTDLVSERLHCHVVLCACCHDGSEAVALIKLRAINTLETVLRRRRQTLVAVVRESTPIFIRLDGISNQSTPFLASSQFVAIPCSTGYLNFDTPRLIFDLSSTQLSF